MAAANSGLQITNLDFTSIKSSLKNFLKQQETLKDYNFDGSALSVLVDLLAYNTQYNAYYLNMVANELFLDSAVLRNSVVSRAKLLNYITKSARTPKASIKLVVNQVNVASLTIPKFTPFISEAVDGVNYTFLTPDATTVAVTANTATFNDLEIVQGTNATYTYTVNKTLNPKLIIQIPDTNVDTSTMTVSVQESSSNAYSETYTLAENYTSLTPTSKVYFLQEGMNGNYEIYFGDGILGATLNDGNVVTISYINTEGSSAAGANNFALMATIGGFSNTAITPILSASSGSDRESIDSIKYSAPKAFAAQGRAVTKEDYVYLIKNNSLNLPIESVSVWGGEENDPPVYGQLFCAIKPSGGFTLTATQKEKLITEVIKPISVVTVTPTIVDPDYNYIKLNTTVLYDPKKTTLTSGQISNVVRNSILDFGRNTLNTFNSTFKMPEMISTIQASEPSIITNESTVRLQKKFFPSLTTKTTYLLDFGTKIKRNYFNTGLTSKPSFSTRDINSNNTIRTGVFFEEIPSLVGGIQSINVVNQGFGYTKVPTVTIVGDGTGASAYAVLVGTRVNSIVVTDPGINYTQATVVITPASGDTSGSLAYAVAILEGSIGILRTYYYNNNVKTILNSEAGTIDYNKGLVTLSNFAPISIDDPLGRFVITVSPESTILASTYNKIVALDEFDPDSITLTINATSV